MCCCCPRKVCCCCFLIILVVILIGFVFGFGVFAHGFQKIKNAIHVVDYCGGGGGGLAASYSYSPSSSLCANRRPFLFPAAPPGN